MCHLSFHSPKHLNFVVFATLRQCQRAPQTLQALSVPLMLRPDLAVHHIATNLITGRNYQDLGELEWKSNYKGNKTRAELREYLTGVIKPSFTFKCPERFDINVSVAALWLPLLGLFAQGLCGGIEQKPCGLSLQVMRKTEVSPAFADLFQPLKSAITISVYLFERSAPYIVSQTG